MGYAIPLWETPVLPIAGSTDAFPVNRIFCVGRNYADHAREMGHDPNREPPFFFTKFGDAVFTGAEYPYPKATNDVHPECEMIVALKEGGADIPESAALDCVFGYGVGFDITRRDMQQEAKDLARPWALSKGPDYAAPCSILHTVDDVGHIEDAALQFTVNGEVRQEGNVNQMIWSTPEMIAFLSTLITLKPGDVIMTGTPAGVSAVVKGDTLVGHVDGLTDLVLTIV
jgi:fumarylpyruvate hydrolase